MSIIFKGLINSVRGYSLIPHQITQYTKRQLATEKSLNQVLLLGRCGTDPLVKGSEERPVVVFSLATNVNVKGDEEGEYSQKTDWHRISVFKQSLRRICLDHVKKGSRLVVQGRISYHSTIGENNTVNRMFSIVADDVIMVHTPERTDKLEVSEESSD